MRKVFLALKINLDLKLNEEKSIDYQQNHGIKLTENNLTPLFPRTFSISLNNQVNYPPKFTHFTPTGINLSWTLVFSSHFQVL